MSLSALLAYCRAHGIHGSYRCRHEEQGWRAYITVGKARYNGLGETREAALDRIAAGALDNLLDPMPAPGADGEYIARKGCGG